MKAAVIFQKGDRPKYVADFAEPMAQHDNELLIAVKASAVKNVDKMRAAGAHYSTKNESWTVKVPGGDGVGILADGTRVYTVGVTGMLAEKALAEKAVLVKVPDGVDDATAAALPNAVMGSALALRFRAGLQKGETVLVNGATGVTGKMVVQVAKYYGAKKVIATGRNGQTLQHLLSLGADEVISLRQTDDELLAQIKNAHQQNSIDVVVDYLWGHTAELILTALQSLGRTSHRTRFVTVGGITGDTIKLSSSILRSTDIHLSGSGLGSWSLDEAKKLVSEMLPEMFQLAAAGKLQIETITLPLSDIEKSWNMQIDGGKRLVILI